MVIGIWRGKALLLQPGEMALWLWGSVPESVTGNYLQRHQQHTELRSNNIVVIQEFHQRMFYKARLFKPKTQF